MTRLLPALLTLLAFPALAHAHAVGVTATLAGERVTIEAFFDDDEPAADAKVTVHDAANVLIAAGKTDAAGAWSFAVPPAGKYAVRVDAGDGHATTTVVTVPHDASVSASISDGPSREARTGWHRWLGVAVGLLGIAAATKVFTQVRRRSRQRG